MAEQSPWRVFVRTSLDTTVLLTLTQQQLGQETTLAPIFSLLEAVHEAQHPHFGQVYAKSLALLAGAHERPGDFYQMAKSLKAKDALHDGARLFAILERQQVDPSMAEQPQQQPQPAPGRVAPERIGLPPRLSPPSTTGQFNESRPAGQAPAMSLQSTMAWGSHLQMESSPPSACGVGDRSAKRVSMAQMGPQAIPSSVGMTGKKGQQGPGNRSREPSVGSGQDAAGDEERQGAGDSGESDDDLRQGADTQSFDWPMGPDGLQIMLRARKLQLLREESSQAGNAEAGATELPREPNGPIAPDSSQLPAPKPFASDTAGEALVGTQASQAPVKAAPAKKAPPNKAPAKLKKPGVIDASILEEAAALEKADAQKRADAEKQSAAAGSLPPIEELKNLVTLKRMTKEAVRLVVNAERALAHQPAVNNVFAKSSQPSWWPLDEWSNKAVDRKKANAEQAYRAARNRALELGL
ncbi:hypothetical protein WJX84_001058 [Apatococcus fuscideae]|uniref:Uncharacterized protein n=1 Tax=Apatococcus fuscideae TaxID=2026836 RepID=A0AAW1TEI7_9CHLO